MTQNLTDNWQIDKILTDHWDLHIPIQSHMYLYSQRASETFSATYQLQENNRAHVLDSESLPWI